jgi:BirA family biotin operon repressor/biotin-[acetyl-CoA-carboxylase] ligase
MEFKVVHIEETDSTNRWLKTHGDESNLCVVAEYQTAGRGCGTNSWESERGKNLTFSMLIHPKDIPASEQFRITEIVSVALCETIGMEASIKWPNDIYVGERKICGILIENRLQGSVMKDSVIGIGLNVNQTVFMSDAPNPVSIKQLTGCDMDRGALLDNFLQTFEEVSARKDVGSDYRKRLFRLGRKAAFADETGRFEGTIVDVEPDGHLLIRDETGQVRQYAFKEVQFLINK